MEKLISIVIPAKNEEITIARCIESAINALKNIKDWEIILVDSYSTDNTIEIAKQYPIRILRLKKEWFKSPHAGRYIGTINSSGKYIFFLDADMIVSEGWIEAAIDFLEKDDKLAGVTGIMYNVLPDEEPNENHRINHPIGYVDYLPGPSVYKKKVLYQVNHFNPFFKGNGEREVGCRIAKMGYLQLRIEKKICYHFQKKYTLDESLEKTSYFIGVGQFLRAHFDKKNVFEMLLKYKLVSTYSFLILVNAFITLGAIAAGNIKIVVYQFIVLAILLFFLMLKQKNPKKTLLDINSLTLKSINFLYGFIKKTKTYHEYPVDIENLK